MQYEAVRYNTAAASSEQQEEMQMKEFLYTFLYQTDLGQKIRDALNSVFPGLIREPVRVPVPVQTPEEDRRPLLRR